MLKQLATNVLYVSDLAQAKQWFQQIFQIQPYFDEPFYVGYDIGGFELGLLPQQRTSSNNSVAYWRVDDIETAMAQFLQRGATLGDAIESVGDGVKVATLLDPFGNHIGIIENQHFKLKAD